MNCLFRSYKSFATESRNICRLTIKTLGLDFDKKTSENWGKISPENLLTNDEEIGQICNFLEENVNWNRLDVCFGSLKLSNSLVDSVLINVREPRDAKRSLSFFHWCSQRKNHDHGVRSYCLMIHILVQSGLIMDAKALLEAILTKNSVSDASLFTVVETLIGTYEVVYSRPFVFDLLVQTCSRLRHYNVAFKICSYLEDRGFMPNLVSLNTLLHVVQRSDHGDLIWEIYEYMVFKRIYPNQFTIKIMVSSMSKTGNLLKVVNILDSIHSKRCSPLMIVNAALVLRIIEQDRTDEGILLARRMLQKNMMHDDVACSMIILAHCKSGDSKLAHEAYDKMMKRGHPINAFVCTALIELLFKERKIDEVKIMLREMHEPYEDTYNVLIEWFSKFGMLDDALDSCKKMVDGNRFLPRCRAVNELIKRLCEGGYVARADELLTFLLERGFVPEESVYSDLIDGYGRERKVQQVLKLFHELEWRGTSQSVLLRTAVIRNLCICGKLTEAEKILSGMQEKSKAPMKEIIEQMMF